MNDRPNILSWTTVDVASAAANRFAHAAMNTEFEVVTPCPDADYAQKAAWAAFDELGRLEQALSRFIEGSDVSAVNALAAGQSVTVDTAAYECLKLARDVWVDTDGAFDMACAGAGSEAIELDDETFTVTAGANGLCVDLGGIGKGFAVDRMLDVLADWELGATLVQAGGSTVRAAGQDGWTVALGPTGQSRVLRDRALSGSGQDPAAPHVIDPRTHAPLEGRLAAWAMAPTAALADALSTAFLVMDPGAIEAYCRNHPNVDGKKI